MRAVMLDVPPHLLAERRRLGHDRSDEMWEGELHMVPPPSEEHQRLGTRLIALLLAVADAAGLHARYEIGLFDPTQPPDESYRQPDLAVYDDSARSERGVEGRALLVIEIRSPGDESFEKLPFYARVGVAEVVVVDRDDKTVRRWARRAGELVEVVAAADGTHHLDALDVTLSTDGGQLIVLAGGTELRI